MLCAHLNENYKPLSCTKDSIGISVNTQVVDCGLNSLKFNMRRHEKEEHTEEKGTILQPLLFIIFFWKGHEHLLVR